MTDVLFSALGLSKNLEQAIETMGFDSTTPVQSQTIPLIRTGADVVARSQTGTGKTVAFSIPALECIDTKTDKPTVQVLILCPTRELAQQAGDEIRKLAEFMPHIHPVEIYGGTNMERQFIRLRQANLVIGTPGRIMDHMRRKTLKLDQLKMIILDEADEMLNMGFKDDIETILSDTPETRQTILFSATMPPVILALAHQYQNDPQMVEINKEQVTIQNIEQRFVDVPASRKNDALTLLLHYHRPNRALVFCNTKRMVDELTVQLNKSGFAAEGLHGDLNQFQRTNVMNSFKNGKISILIATDVAARGIDVNDLDYVFNYDIPMQTEYYVHRIGRTGRAGKSGCAITICCGRRQVFTLSNIARAVKSEILPMSIPTAADIKARKLECDLAAVEELLTQAPEDCYLEMVRALGTRGHDPEQVAAAALQLQFHEDSILSEPFPTIPTESEQFGRRTDVQKRFTAGSGRAFTPIRFDIGSANRVAPNHLVGAITEISGLSGKEIGKIKIFPDHSIVEISDGNAQAVLEAMLGRKICGRPIHAAMIAEFPKEQRGASMRPAKPRSPHAAKRPAPHKDYARLDPRRTPKRRSKQYD